MPNIFLSSEQARIVVNEVVRAVAEVKACICRSYSPLVSLLLQVRLAAHHCGYSFGVRRKNLSLRPLHDSLAQSVGIDGPVDCLAR